MILSTHAIVGGAIASLFPSHPGLVAALGVASHYAIDAIPHWDYPLQSISLGRGADNRSLRRSRGLLLDLMLVGFDACAGLGLAIWLFATSATLGVIIIGACAAMLPDPLQFLQSLYPHEPLKSLQRFHHWMHAKQKLSWVVGASSQAMLAVAVTEIAMALR
jgi:hypothetical protein